MNLAILLGIPGIYQVLIILAVVLLLFGGRKIPELMKGLGRGIREFKDGVNPKDKDDDKEDKKIKDNN